MKRADGRRGDAQEAGDVAGLRGAERPAGIAADGFFGIHAPRIGRRRTVLDLAHGGADRGSAVAEPAEFPDLGP